MEVAEQDKIDKLRAFLIFALGCNYEDITDSVQLKLPLIYEEEEHRD